MTKRIGIVGFGASGLSFLAQFLETNPVGYEVLVFDPDENGLGDAFREQPSFNLMNTSVEVTSLFEQKPDDFRDWLNESPAEWKRCFPEKDSFDGSEIVPRLLFGRYLRSRRENLLKRCADRGLPVRRIGLRVIDLVHRERACTLVTEAGETFDVDYVLLFTGNFKRCTFPKLRGAPGFVESVYGPPLPEATSVLILGTKLSAIDAILRVAAEQPTAKVVAASRTGELPAPNHSIDLRNSRADKWLSRERFDSYKALGAGETLNQLLKNAWQDAGSTWDVDHFVKEDPVQRLKSQVAGEHSEEKLILPLAELLESLWWNFGPSERAEILTRYFKAIMHFVGAFPVENARAILQLLDCGRLEIRRALQTVEPLPEGGFQATFGDGSVQRFASVIDATGYDNGLTCHELSPLMRRIVERKYLELNGFGGFNVTRDFQVTSPETETTRVFSAGFPIKASVPFANWFNRIVSATNRIARAIGEGRA